MLEDMPRNRHIHLYLEENEANFSNETTETTQTRYINTTETHETVITEMHETHETYKTFMTELNSEEDTKYVADDTDSSVCGFEYNENDVRKRGLYMRANPQYPIKALRQDVLEYHVYKVSLSKCLRAKHLALDMVLGSHKGQYSKIYDYLGEIRYSNPGSTTILRLDNRMFERMYICLQECKEGFKGCRPIISIDGCHLKGYYGGTLLAVVGIDCNDNIYPIAYAVVESEIESSWTWFLLLLATDLEIETSHNITFMSDKQKGLVKAMMHVLPNAEHRTCVRHLYSNFKNNAQFKGNNLKDAMWKAARATYKKEFEDAMDELKALSKPAFDWLNAKNPAQWSKSHFSPRSKSDMLLSNLSECFNKMILEARDKPILTLMGMIRTKIMENISNKNKVANKYTGSLCPRIQKKIELAIQQSTRCWPTHAGGIPCIHDVSVMVINNQRPKAYVHNSYFVTTQREIYSHFIQPMRGPNQWLTDTTCEPVIPPTIRRPPGRPKKKMRNEVNEPTNSHAIMSKKGLMMYCSKCGQPGHNQRTCKGIVGGNMPPRRPNFNSTRETNEIRVESRHIRRKLHVRRRTTTRITPSSKVATSSQAATSQPPSSS
ncbi:hypothetical protein F3Y22_tig00111127pilonHSYRG00005 [Hibiscus syriacus]|uniref:CCHC-type domain-containing protein n=1 Tax=Hibiscus syriacus TaxID=106335 RepID=A0A6A2YZ61_HIBSY|nr:hypothetical protein F3Y22_tig00111127pilonHSYRG00005 [Hibiscus syriacus]